ncbi:unnamed protein product [Acanthoscelides obtectus]|uniref:MADF domain-containing protein n=1 Tax=Acanthoscelides obtectus TaxID=200917 RepID=A0A9P0MIX7_ACAOB|nr:unnamed protein product [Acanthoscelides obtectus]CAK1640422.1 hypothetical protein AOBTE_LOCUS11713 [Acanthoscelides obtectus]
MAGEFQWSDELVLDLIYEIEQRRHLWDPKDEDKKNRNKKSDAFKSLGKKFGVTPEEIIKKYEHLLQSYRKCCRKAKNSIKTGAGTSDVYKPVWFAFEALNKFMKDVYTPHGVTDTMTNEAKSNDDDRDNDASIIPESPEDADTVDTQQTTEANREQDVAPDNRAHQKRKKFTNDSDERAEMTFQYLQTKMQEGRKEIDECIAFGNLIADDFEGLTCVNAIQPTAGIGSPIIPDIGSFPVLIAQKEMLCSAYAFRNLT